MAATAPRLQSLVRAAEEIERLPPPLTDAAAQKFLEEFSLDTVFGCVRVLLAGL